jgi:hypothetical protein
MSNGSIARENRVHPRENRALRKSARKFENQSPGRGGTFAIFVKSRDTAARSGSNGYLVLLRLAEIFLA